MPNTEFDKEISVRFDASVLDMPLIKEGGIDTVKQAYKAKRHRHEHYEFFYTYKGERHVFLDHNDVLRMKGGMFSFIQPETDHGNNDVFLRPSHYLWLIIDPDHPEAARYTPFTQNHMRTLAGMLKSDEHKTLMSNETLKQYGDKVQALARIYHQQNDEFLIIPKLRSALAMIIAEAIRQYQGEHQPELSNSVASACDWIKAHLQENLSIDEIAEKFHMSSRNFFLQFKKELGLTPADYIQRERCAKAKSLLAQKKHTITEIAYMLGYSSASYFSIVFKKYSGKTPTQYIRIWEENRRLAIKEQANEKSST